MNRLLFFLCARQRTCDCVVKVHCPPGRGKDRATRQSRGGNESMKEADSKQPDKQESDMRHKVWESCQNSVNPVATRKGDV